MDTELLEYLADSSTIRFAKDKRWGKAQGQFLKLCQSLEEPINHNRKTMTQIQKLINHLKTAGSISQREAIMDYSIQSLTKRISELRNDYNMNIKTVWYQHPVTCQKYARYYLLDTNSKKKAA